MDNLGLRDQQYDILYRHIEQIRNDEQFEGFSLATLKIKKELIQEAFDNFRRFHLSYRLQYANNLILQNTLYEEVEDHYTINMAS